MKAKHGLNKTWIRTIGLSFLRDQTVKREEEKREEEEEEEKKKRIGEEREIKKVWKLTLSMEIMKISMDLWNSKVLYG